MPLRFLVSLASVTDGIIWRQLVYDIIGQLHSYAAYSVGNLLKCCTAAVSSTAVLLLLAVQLPLIIVEGDEVLPAACST